MPNERKIPDEIEAHGHLHTGKIMNSEFIYKKKRINGKRMGDILQLRKL